MKLLLFLFLSLSFSKNIDISKDKGKVVYVDFWASWCSPCKLSFPWMKTIYDKYHKKGFVIYAVNLDEDRSDANRFLKEFPNYPFNYIFDKENTSLESYSIKSLPTAIVYNREGKEVFRHVGFKEDQVLEYEKKIRSLLEQ